MEAIYWIILWLTSCCFRYLNFFNSTYVVTEKSKWNIDDGYLHYLDKNILVNVVPARTSGVSYYHRLKLFLFLKDEEFVGCPNNRLENFFFVSFILLIVSTKFVVYCVVKNIFLLKLHLHLKIFKKIHCFLYSF